MVSSRVALGAITLVLLGCSVTTTYETTTTLYPTRVEGAFRSHRYRLVGTGLTGSAHAPVDDPASTRLATQAMDALVTAAKLAPGQALTGVTLEEGLVEVPGKAAIRVVTLRADVVELAPGDAP